MAVYMQQDDTGVLIQVTVMDAEDTSQPYDISGATSKYILLGPPIGDAMQVTASYSSNNGTDGVLQYATSSGDINHSGEWEIQAYWVTSGGDERHSTVDVFDVYENIS